MAYLLQSAKSTFLIISILLCWFPQNHQFAIASDPVMLYNYSCIGSGHYTPNSYFQFNLANVFANLTNEAALTGFYNTTVVTSPHPAYGLYLCRGDIDNQDCHNCVLNATQTIVGKCPYQTGALIWYDQCMLRYSNESFFSTLNDFNGFSMCNMGNFTGNTTKSMEITMNTVTKLATEVANNNKKFGTMEAYLDSYNNVYVLEQCTLDLSENDCAVCLQDAIDQISYYCSGRRGGRALMSSCNVRYEAYPFYSQIPAPAPAPAPAPMSAPGSAAISPIATVDINEIETTESLQYDLSTIKAATRNFSAENKLGEGGFGIVYKGKLENGQEVAVKRLSKNSGQGILEFKNEVVLVAKLQHKNLVKLLGFCLAAKENILVYELVPNASLDRFLFDPVKRATLDWETRFRIIKGIARGLLYLHEDSRLKITHRDLKSSNILLDEAMNPKISDFGLARLFGVDQTQDATKRVAGTYGYMTPEYVTTGHFSVKSDVYSFGVIVLEIVSGQKNRTFSRAQHEEALLHRAWRLWNEEVVSQLVDEALNNNYSNKEITKCIHIGLLCIQEDPTKRPGMAVVVASLNGQSISLPLPIPPCSFTTTTEDNAEALEHQKEIQLSDFKVCAFTGTENITDLYPR